MIYYIHVVNLNLYIIADAVPVKMLQNNSEPRENGEKGIPNTVPNLGLQLYVCLEEESKSHHLGLNL